MLPCVQYAQKGETKKQKGMKANSEVGVGFVSLSPHIHIRALVFGFAVSYHCNWSKDKGNVPIRGPKCGCHDPRNADNNDYVIRSAVCFVFTSFVRNM